MEEEELLSGFLEPIDLSILDAEEESTESPWEEESFDPSDFDEVVSYPTSEEMEAADVVVEAEAGAVENDVGEEE